MQLSEDDPVEIVPTAETSDPILLQQDEEIPGSGMQCIAEPGGCFTDKRYIATGYYDANADNAAYSTFPFKFYIAGITERPTVRWYGSSTVTWSGQSAQFNPTPGVRIQVDGRGTVASGSGTCSTGASGNCTFDFDVSYGWLAGDVAQAWSSPNKVNYGITHAAVGYGSFNMTVTWTATLNGFQGLPEGFIYTLETGGGDWLDPTNSHYDTAVSWDGDDWMTLAEFAAGEWTVCYDVDSDHSDLMKIYFNPVSPALYIRVNDTVGQFADNVVGETLYYVLGTAYQTGLFTCSDQFTYDEQLDWVASVVVHANQPSASVDYSFTTAEWYVIEIASGSWYDNGAGPFTDLQAAFPDDFTESWFDLADGSWGVGCANTPGDGETQKYYLQARTPEMLLRVNDALQTWSDNTGEVGVNIYRATYDRFLSSCESIYRIGDWVAMDSVQANQQNGKAVVSVNDSLVPGAYQMTPGGWYMIETEGGPWRFLGSAHGGPNFDMAVSTDRLIWQSLDDWSVPACNVATDNLGHQRIYFQAPDTAATTYYFRVNDSEKWDNNIGSLGWEIYEIVKQNVQPTRIV